MTEHPLTQTMSRIMRIQGYLKVEMGPLDSATNKSDWFEPSTLFAMPSGMLYERIVDAQKQLQSKSAAMIGSWLLQAYHWPIITAPIGCYLIDKRVPDLALENVKVRLGENGDVEAVAFTSSKFATLPTDPAAAHLDAQVMPDVVALRTYLRQGLETHLGWIIEQLCQQIGCKPRGLWLDVADRCAATLIWLMQQIDERTDIATIEDEMEALLRVPASPLNHKKVGLFTLTHHGQTQAFLDRATCCHWYRTKEANGDCCSTCPRRTQTDRNERLLQYMAEQFEMTTL